nr:MAG TPA: hypothetical protein [Caudoviricetes sp.]
MGAIQSGVNTIVGSVTGGIKAATDLTLKKNANQALKSQLAQAKSDIALRDLKLKNEQLKLRLARRQQVYELGKETLKKQKERAKKRAERKKLAEVQKDGK